MLKVKLATLHAVYFPGFGAGTLPNKLDTVGAHQGMDITWRPEGLFVEYKGVHFFIPSANVVGCTFVEAPKFES